jgi:hypothetical protein
MAYCNGFQCRADAPGKHRLHREEAAQESNTTLQRTGHRSFWPLVRLIWMLNLFRRYLTG